MNDLIADNTGVPSQWQGLSRHLISEIYVCDAHGVADPDVPSVYAPITDASISFAHNWQNPFENSGTGQSLPALSAMIQTGQLGAFLNTFTAATGIGTAEGSMTRDLNDKLQKVAKNLEHRTGLTRVNSRQVFVASQPVKIECTLHFRAYSDPENEVVAPYRRLLEWTLPQELANDTVLQGMIKNGVNDPVELLTALFPSTAPRIVGFRKADETYAPLVVEGVSAPLDGPIDSQGLPLYRSVQVSMSTLTALDKSDVQKIYRR